MKKLSVVAIGISRSKQDKVLDVYYPLISVNVDQINLSAEDGDFIAITNENKNEYESVFNSSLDSYLKLSEARNIYAKTKVGALYLKSLSEAIRSVEEAYLKLQLQISQQL